MKIPASHVDLLDDGTKAHAYLATLMPDGSPQVTPVWFNMDGDDILVNTARGRVKDRNMRVRPRTALVIADPRILSGTSRFGVKSRNSKKKARWSTLAACL